MRKKVISLFFLWCINLLYIMTPVSAESVQDMIKNSGVKGGLIVHIGCGDGKQTALLRKETLSDSPGTEDYIIQGLDSNWDNIKKARQYIQSKGLYGQISINHFDEKKLPYIDNLVNLIIADKRSVSEEEIMRVLAPLGVAYIEGKKITKPWPEDIDEWTHFLHGPDNNAVARDTVIGPPQHMQWLSHPLWTRSHASLNSISTVVSAKGRIFTIRDEGPLYDNQFPAIWSVTAIDAFNGLLLWKRNILSWTPHLYLFRKGPVQLQRLLVTDGDRVYCPLGLDKPVSVLDAGTGKVIKTFSETEHTEEIILYKGILLVQISENQSEQSIIRTHPKIKHKIITDVDFDYKKSKAILAVNPDTGKTLWRYPRSGTAEIMPQSLSANEGRVFIQEGSSVVSLNIKDGRKKWQTEVFTMTPTEDKKSKKTSNKTDDKKKKKKKKKSEPKPSRRLGWTYNTLVVKNNVVLIANEKKLHALSAETGKKLWDSVATEKKGFGNFSATPAIDILVVDGIVWPGPHFAEGRDVRTGKVVSRNNLQKELISTGHHHRCYRDKATSSFIIQSVRGVAFRDLKGDNHARNNWIRGSCQYGVMPANGLINIPPNNCGCFMEARLYGFWGLAAEQSLISEKELSGDGELEKGPAYNRIKQAAVSGDDWPLYRHDAARSCVTVGKVSSNPKKIWDIKPAGRMTAPVISQNKMIVSSIDTYQVLAYDATTGKGLWQFTTEGPVDSPPSIYGHSVLFGSADGNVYCLRLSDGVLVWRFRAAPLNLNTVALGHVESVWPVHGSVLIHDNTVYFTAGRSTYLDGGIFLYGLDPLSGKVKYKSRMNIPAPGAMKDPEGFPRTLLRSEDIPKSQNATDIKTFKGPDKSDAYSMYGNISDIMVGNEKGVFLRHMKFDKELNKQDDFDFHLFSTSRIIDNSQTHRSHLFYGRGDFSGIPVGYEFLTLGLFSGFQSPLGKLLVFDKKSLWGVDYHHKGREKGIYYVFTRDISNISKEVKKDFPKHTHDKAKHKKIIVESLNKDGLKGIENGVMRARALIKVGDHLIIGGFRYNESLTYRDRKPIPGEGVIMQYIASTGKLLSEIKIPSPSIYDGIASADGKLYISCEDGSILCLK